MKSIYITSRFALAYVCLFTVILSSISSCKKSPIEDVRIIIDPAVIKYAMLLEFRDAADNKITPQDVTLSFSGEDSEYIYESAGKKKFVVQAGLINIGLSPDRIPTTGSPAKFSVTVNANGYLPLTRDLEISAENKVKVVRIELINIAKPPAGLEIIQQAVSLVGGRVAKQTAYGISSKGGSVNQKLSGNKISAGSTPSVAVDDQTQVVLPEGTKFYYYQWIKTGTVTSTIKDPVYQTDKIELSEGNGTATYTRIVNYVTREIETEVGKYEKVTLTKNEVKINALYRTGQDIPFSVYPNGLYPSLNVKLLSGQTLPEDKILYKSAVTRKLADLYFTAKVEDKSEAGTFPREVIVTPENPVSWYTSFVLNPAFINPVTNKAIVAGDIIECGLDPENGTTLKTTVKEVTLSGGNKQLRAESQTTDIGYYYPALHTADYDYSFNTNLADGIADINNVKGYVTVGVSAGNSNWGSGYEISANRGEARLSGKIRSFNPIQIASSYGVSYWGKSYSSTPISSGNGSFNVFAEIYQRLKIEPTVSFDITFVCNSSKKEFKGFGIAYITGNDGKTGYANVVNGKWETNGFTQGQMYSAVIPLNGAKVNWSNVIQKTQYVQRIVDNANLCSN